MEETRDLEGVPVRAPSKPETLLQTGTTFQSQYEIMTLLGEGGFGQVYKARQLSTGQLVAIKVIQPLRGTPTAEKKINARFTREMQLCADLNHPNIVPLVDTGETESGKPFTVFAFVPGDDLADVLGREGKLDPVEAQHLMGQVLDALGAAHAREMVHRDLKPGNIMVSPTGARRNALVLDFGIGVYAKQPLDDEMTQVTETRELIGTPAYAAPEQLRGELPSVRSDLYSWGLVMLECLTGQRVMDGASLSQVLYKQFGPEPIPIPKYIRRHPVGELLRKVLDKDLKGREVSAGSVLKELEACNFTDLRRKLRRSEAVGTAETLDSVPFLGGSAPAPLTEDRSADTYVWTHGVGERRMLTIVDCLFPSTIDASVDPEDLDALVQRRMAQCGEVAQEHAGHVGRVHGERVQIYFGYPEAEEDDPQRAARAALELVDRVRRVTSDDTNGVQVGVHAGQVIARESDEARRLGLEDVVGMAPKIASRLSDRAEPGAVLVSEQMRPLLRSFTLEPAGQLQLGQTNMEVLCLGEETVEGTLSHTDRAPMVGRDNELAMVREFWNRSRDGAGHGVLLLGEPGIGKSRMTRELVRVVNASDDSWLECRCNARGHNSALRPFIDLLEMMIGAGRQWSEEQRLDGLEQLLTNHDLELKTNAPVLGALLGIPTTDKYAPLDISPHKQKELCMEGILSLLFGVAEKRPLLLVVEDLHWADPTTLELLGKLVQDVQSAAMCVLMTGRPEFSPQWPAAAVQQIQLGRLGREHVSELALGLTGGRRLPDEVIEEVARRTDGVSLFVEELVAVLLESDLLVAHDDHYSLTGSLEDLAIPDSLRSLLAARLDRLGEAKETAQLAAALGREFTHEIIAAVSDRDEADLDDELQALIKADLIFRRRRARGPSYLFKHALIQDMAHESLVKAARADVHRHIAATMEATFPDLVQRRPELLAHHHAAADQKPQALGYAMQASLGCLMRSENHEVIGHATRALDWLDGLPDEKARAETEIGLNGLLTPALMATRGFADAELKIRVDRSQELFALVGESPQTAPTLWALITYHQLLSHIDTARELCWKLLSMAEAAGVTGFQVAAGPAAGMNDLMEGRLKQAAAPLERAIELYDAEQHLPMAAMFGMELNGYAHSLLGLVVGLGGEADRGLELIDTAIEHARGVKHANSVAVFMSHKALLQSWLWDREGSLATVQALVQLAQDHGLPMMMGYAGIMLGWCTGAPEMAEQAVTGLEAVGYEMGMSNYRCLWASMEADRGEADKAMEIIERSLVRTDETSEGYFLSGTLRLKGVVLQQQRPDDAGALDEAEACLRQAVQVAKDQGAGLLELGATLELARLLQKRGAADEARGLLAEGAGRVNGGQGTPLVTEVAALMEELG